MYVSTDIHLLAIRASDTHLYNYNCCNVSCIAISCYGRAFILMMAIGVWKYNCSIIQTPMVFIIMPLQNLHAVVKVWHLLVVHFHRLVVVILIIVYFKTVVVRLLFVSKETVSSIHKSFQQLQSHFLSTNLMLILMFIQHWFIMESSNRYAHWYTCCSML